jgi:hypothetical protein
MSLDTDRMFRRIWLVNGILLLLTLLGSLGIASYGILRDLWDTETGVRPASGHPPPAADLRPRAVRYDAPDRILGSRWMLAQVRYGTDYGERSSNGLGLGSAVTERSYGREGPLVNVMFLPPDAGPGRLLLDRAGYIQNLDFPRERRHRGEEPIDSVPWITYAIAFEDTDRSGRLDPDDAAELYISDLDGTRFRRVLPPGLRVRATQVLPDQRLLITALDARGAERKSEDQLSQRAFRFNPRTDQLVADGVLDSLAASAGRTLGRR